MPTHTPGPWTYQHVEDSWNHVAAENGARAVAKVFGAGSGAGEANARLIAAAPALLEALVQAEEALFTAESYLMSTHDKLSVVEARQAVRAAIAQVKGRWYETD